MRHVGPARVEMGVRTIFNILGPLANPASVKRLLVGTFAREWVEPMAQVLGNLGTERAWVVHGADGLDELTITGPSYVAELADGKVTTENCPRLTQDFRQLHWTISKAARRPKTLKPSGICSTVKKAPTAILHYTVHPRLCLSQARSNL